MSAQNSMEMAWLVSALSMPSLALALLFLWYRSLARVPRRGIPREKRFDSPGFLMMAIALVMSGCWCLYVILWGLGPEYMDPFNHRGILILVFAVVNGFWGVPMSFKTRDFIRRYAEIGVNRSEKSARDVTIVRTIGVTLSAITALLTVLWMMAIPGQ